jgi:hypothetical protein
MKNLVRTKPKSTYINNHLEYLTINSPQVLSIGVLSWVGRSGQVLCKVNTRGGVC